MRPISLKSSFLAALLLTQPAAAQSVSEQGAKQLSDTLATYFGRPAIDKQIVIITPEGDSYRWSIDPRRVADLANFPADRFKMEPWIFRTTPLADGTWLVRSDAMPRISFSASLPNGEMHHEIAVGGYRFDGTFDPKIKAFSKGTVTADSIDTDAKDPISTVNAHARDLKVETSAVEAGKGINAKVHETIGSLTETVKIALPDKDAVPGMPTEIAINFGSAVVDANFDTIRNQDIFDIWAFLVANPSKQQLQDHQDELKAKLRNALPLWNMMAVNIGLQNGSITLPQGVFGVKSFAENLGFSGALPNGTFALGFKIEGLTLPSGLLPAWTSTLMPSLIELNMKFSGADLDKIARIVIDEADLKAASPWPATLKDRLGAMILANKPRILVENSHFVAADYDFTIDSETLITLPKPSGKVTIVAKDFDRTIAALQQVAQHEAQVQQMMPAVILAKGLAKAGPTGGSVWVVEYDGDSAVTVNGQRLGPPKK